eukprot:scaffold27491_cov49-Phaeocystis_antarctica.AAC.2
MYGMFYVRSSPCPAPYLQSSPPLHAACTVVARRLPPPSPHVVPHRMPSFRLSAGRVGVQPAAELRHLQRHKHVRHVPGALLPVPCPISAVEPSPAPCLCTAVARRPRASRATTPPRSVCPLCDSAVRKLPVQRQQAAHPLRVGGHLGLHHRGGSHWLGLRVRKDRLECCSSLSSVTSKTTATSYRTSTVYGEELGGERHFYHTHEFCTSLIAANKRDYLPDRQPACLATAEGCPS